MAARTAPPSRHTFRGSSRVDEARYRAGDRTIEVVFVDGTRFQYHDCTVQTWENFIRSGSPGRFIHDILDQHPYERG